MKAIFPRIELIPFVFPLIVLLISVFFLWRSFNESYFTTARSCTRSTAAAGAYMDQSILSADRSIRAFLSWLQSNPDVDLRTSDEAIHLAATLNIDSDQSKAIAVFDLAGDAIVLSADLRDQRIDVSNRPYFASALYASNGATIFGPISTNINTGQQTIPLMVKGIVNNRPLVVSTALSADRLTSFLATLPTQEARKTAMKTPGGVLIGSGAEDISDEMFDYISNVKPLGPLGKSAFEFSVGGKTYIGCFVKLNSYPVSLAQSISVNDTFHIWLRSSGELVASIIVAAVLTLALSIWLFSAVRAQRRDHADLQTLVEKAERSAAQYAEQREIAVAANRAKSKFLATMSHELRTPLNAIIGFSTLIANQVMGRVGNDKYCEYATDILRSGEHLLSLINDILDLSRIEAGKFELRLEKVDVPAVAADALSALNAIAAAKNIDLTISTDHASYSACADKRALHQILTNLIGNAVKFTEPGGEVRIHIGPGPVDERIEIDVVDNGRGIPADRLPDLGQPFTQLSDEHTRDHGGSGLGLAICFSLAKAMQGELLIESVYGEGTRVRLMLPTFGAEQSRPAP